MINNILNGPNIAPTLAGVYAVVAGAVDGALDVRKDPTTGVTYSTLFDLNSSKFFTPASNNKVRLHVACTVRCIAGLLLCTGSHDCGRLSHSGPKLRVHHSVLVVGCARSRRHQ